MRTVVLCALVLWGSAWGSPQCGGVLRHHKGSLSTPHFPGPFPVPIRCRWLIENTLPGTLLVARLTQVFVTAGLKLTEFVHYEPGSPQFQLGGRLLVAVSADDDPASSNATSGVVTTERPYLVVDFRLAALEGNHVRALPGLLDVYGFNMTYESVREPHLVPACSVADCSYSGHCYASADYRMLTKARQLWRAANCSRTCESNTVNSHQHF